MARRVWRVSRRARSWQVKRDGATRATKTFATKDEARDAAIEVARANSPSRVVIHRVDGTVERELEYGEAAGLSYAGVFEGPDDSDRQVPSATTLVGRTGGRDGGRSPSATDVILWDPDNLLGIFTGDLLGIDFG